MRMTKARGAIIDIFEKSKTPIDAGFIALKLEAHHISADLATVYRNISTLLETNIVRSVDFSDGTGRYELRDRPHHHHAICTRCGKIQDIKNCDYTTLEKEVVEKLKFKIKKHNLEFFGLCSNCQ
ncbi:hypothetical protein A3D80_00740 [Candidatus Roizmanbacteria bacterium RIFCSPHIGHO2_02_FULL_40_13b]|uniref:Transcriptional repressor n=1 Tax=Candidatus Roizmanbacteria bacterium RIFCSPHIGHO2_01_FULL_39_24 TaxID=1802032 RepID=A0A1F7GJB6_9BACT|nr:MAG: hypothetical protein A2799_03305 [Candidatus Roizmanbacteria bacterium RIFCSPHIGHO2_01_FULL_39_24]OGK27471.1 MAG: hypothetical protein A3D80_00740 [Candidatus Roizmanbacteria bacterium RIFCSPHIGHO2_02_FULL_40_13b]OGK49665.1 MAG: hypothetical protein A3A56_02665 [Candidatus Roizmanbacteria bacterium RIFCSPLOWO2_01_FULL_40_32]OGK56139.1 MAG: hypothetical protein A3H83_02390 [Candidatus Roizmanbacteria bacterium RIFCSPLOWO2_02_FULL_39_8]